MKNKKAVITFGIIIVTYLILAIIFFGWDSFMNKIQGVKIVFSTGDKWQLKDGKWIDIEDSEEYNWKKFNVYVDNELLGKYSLLYNNKWYVYDKKRNLINYEGNILGISGNKKYKVIDFEQTIFDTTGENILKDILNKKGITYAEPLSSTKVSLDIDGDNQIETIYTAANLFNDIGVDSKDKYSVMFIKDDEIQVVYEDYQDKDKEYSMCIPKVNSIIDFNKDSKYEIIMECNYYSNMGTCTGLYELQDGKYKEVRGC